VKSSHGAKAVVLEYCTCVVGRHGCVPYMNWSPCFVVGYYRHHHHRHHEQQQQQQQTTKIIIFWYLHVLLPYNSITANFDPFLFSPLNSGMCGILRFVAKSLYGSWQTDLTFCVLILWILNNFHTSTPKAVISTAVISVSKMPHNDVI